MDWGQLRVLKVVVYVGRKLESKTNHFECGGETVATLCYRPAWWPFTESKRSDDTVTAPKPSVIFCVVRLKILKWEYLRIKDEDKIRPRIWREKKIFPHTIAIWTYLPGMFWPHFWAAETQRPFMTIWLCGGMSIVWTFQEKRDISRRSAQALQLHSTSPRGRCQLTP